MRTKNTNKKLFGGLLLAIVIITGMVIQSCQTEGFYSTESNRKIALDNFESLLEKTAPNFQEIAYKQEKSLNTKSISLRRSLRRFQNSKIENKLDSLVKISKELLSSYGISDKYLKSEFENPSDPRIALAGILILTKSKEKLKTYQTASFGGFLLSDLMSVNTANTQISDRAWSCIKSALGITAIRTLINSTRALTTARTALQIVKHLGLRYLGYIGVAVAIYNFTKCMMGSSDLGDSLLRDFAKNRIDGYYAYPDDPNKYIVVHNGYANIRMCPHSLIFSEEEQRCVFPR